MLVFFVVLFIIRGKAWGTQGCPLDTYQGWCAKHELMTVSNLAVSPRLREEEVQKGATSVIGMNGRKSCVNMEGITI